MLIEYKCLIVVSFIGYKDGKKVRPLCIMLPKISTYRRDLDETKYMAFLIKNDELLEIWNKINRVIKKGFNSESIYNDQYIKIKIKS